MSKVRPSLFLRGTPGGVRADDAHRVHLVEPGLRSPATDLVSSRGGKSMCSVIPIGSLATFGYATKDARETLDGALEVNTKALLIDTRHIPWCGWSKVWQRPSLEEYYGKRYLWRGDWLGNIHHDNPHSPIQLANEEKGIAWLISWLDRGKTLILLCACARYETCHRKVIYDKVQAQIGERLIAFTPGARVMTPY